MSAFRQNDTHTGFSPISWTTMDSAPVVVPAQESTAESNQISHYSLVFGDATTATDDTPQPSNSRGDPSSSAKSMKTKSSESHYRDPKNGAMTFKADTENDLFMHVRNGLGDHIRDYSDVESAKAILRSIDVYCLGKQWMFHVGQEKGEIMEGFLCKCISEISSLSNSQDLIVVELGTYCGYSAILLAKSVREFAPDLKFHVYSTEIDEKNARVANNMIKMAKLDRYISVIVFDPTVKSISGALKEHIPEKKIDFLFLDHAKTSYLRDLQELEKKGFVAKGTYVAADNVVFYKELKDYCGHIRRLANRSIVETKTVEIKLEYSSDSQNLDDGIELTVYLQDPPKDLAGLPVEMEQ